MTTQNLETWKRLGQLLVADDVNGNGELDPGEKLVALGLEEIVSYSFVSQSMLDLLDPDSAGRRVVLPNPVSAEHGVLRDSLLPQILECLGRNLARQTLGEIATGRGLAACDDCAACRVQCANQVDVAAKVAELQQIYA